MIIEIISRRFGANLPMAEELGSVLAPKFDNSDLPEYAGLCWMAAAKCEEDLENKVAAVDLLLKAGRAFVQADERCNELNGSSNSHEHLTEAIRCYNNALALVADDSALRAGTTIKKRLCTDSEVSSNFVSTSHRIHDLDTSARKHIRSRNYHAALEQLTEIFDILKEEKSEEYYQHTLARAEVLILYLLLLLKLPPARQSPIHMKILNKYVADYRNIFNDRISNSMTDGYLLALTNLAFVVTTCCDSHSPKDEVAAARLEVLCHCSAAMESPEHSSLLEDLANKFT